MSSTPLNHDLQKTVLHRQRWLPALAVLSLEELDNTVQPLLAGYEIEHQALPEDGLGLLKIRDGALGQSFYLGEFPLATAHILLRAPSGQGFPGAAQFLGDSVDKAVLMAVCDAVLSNALPESPGIESLVRTGLKRLQERDRQRSAMLERTRVDFDLLSTSQGGADVD